jgi:mRNA interferase RelE/StbE
MEVIITKQFAKDVLKELDKPTRLLLANIIEKIKEANSLNEIQHLKKLGGHTSAFRIRLNNYRIGFLLENNVVKLSRILNRKDIYKYFP